MYNALIALGIGAVTTVLFSFLLGGGSFAILYGIAPGIIALVVAYFLLARRTYKQLQEYFQKAQKPLQDRNIESAVNIIKKAYPLGKWQFLVNSQIDAQIGTILYSARKFDRAKEYLERAFDNNNVVNAVLSQNWRAPAMLGVVHYKNKDFDEMRDVFENAVATNKDKPLLWNVYAYCLWKSRNRSDAIDVLNRAVEENPDDQKTQDNLNALKNNSKMNMSGWGNQWYQFHLDRPPQKQARRQMQFRHQR